MKIILILLLSFILTNNVQTNEVWSNPICEYVQSGDLEQWEEVKKCTVEDETFMSRISWRFTDKFYLDECLYTEVLPYNTDIIWHFSKPFMEDDEVYIVLVNQDYVLTNILRGHPLPDGNVLFDFSLVNGGTYYFFEFSNVDI